jgi:hypothetical protein
MINSLVKKKSLKPSTVEFVNAMNTACLRPTYANDHGFFISFNDCCEILRGWVDPDYKKPREFKLSSKSSRYYRLQKLIKSGLLTSYEKPADLEYSGFLYQLVMPRITISDAPTPSSDLQLTSAYRKARKLEEQTALNMSFGYFAKPIEQLGSMDILATYFNDCIRANSAITTKFIKKEKVIRNPESKKLGHLMIETTTSSADDAEIMIGDDMVLLNYIYSSINEQLAQNFEQLSVPFQNLFRFDKRRLLLDAGYNDGGGNRKLLDKQLSRIVNTQFSLESDSEALWLMNKLGLVDGNGKPYSKAPIKLIEEAGELDFSSSKEEIDVIFKERGSRRYLDLKLPSFLERQINRTILSYKEKVESSNSRLPILKMFNRDKKLLKGEEKGVIWLLNDYLSSKLARPGFAMGPIYLSQFLPLYNASLVSKKEILAITKHIFLALGHQRHLLYRDEWIVNSRSQPRLKKLYSMIDNKYLVAIDNVTQGYTPTTRISNIKYSIRIIRLTDAEVIQCQERNQLVNQDIAYSEDKIFIDTAEAIFDRAPITASKYK